MSPIEFPEQTIVWAKNQPPYLGNYIHNSLVGKGELR